VYNNAQVAIEQANAAIAARDRAETATANALSAMNFKGDWSTLSGPLARPATVQHNNSVWLLMRDVANVAVEVPGVSTAWINQTARVSSVMGRTGDVVGLVEQTAANIAAGTNLDTVRKSGFYRLEGTFTLGGVDVSLGQMIVSCGVGGSIFQIAAHFSNGNVVCRGGDLGGNTFSPWQRVMTDRVLAERLFGTAINASTYAVVLSNGSIQQFTLNTSTTITMPAKRQDGDQCTLLLYQGSNASVAFSSNVRLPKGSSMPTIVAGELLTVSMIALNDAWYAYIGAKHNL
jgi:hypothetical protein